MFQYQAGLTYIVYFFDFQQIKMTRVILRYFLSLERSDKVFCQLKTVFSFHSV